MRRILTVSLVLTLAVLYGSWLNAWLLPSQMPGLNFLALALPAATVILGIIFILLILSGHWKVFLLGLLFCLPLLPSIQRWYRMPLPYSSPQRHPGPQLRIVTFNGKMTNDVQRKRIAAFLKKHDFDIIFLQEVGYEKPESNLPYQHTDELLLGTYSRYPIVRKMAILHYPENKECTAIRTDIRIENDTISLFNVHLASFNVEKKELKPTRADALIRRNTRTIFHRMNRTFRLHQNQIKVIRQAIEECPHPVILGGDFNAVPNSFEYFYLGKDLSDAQVTAGRGPAVTKDDLSYPLRIDYLFADPRYQWTDHRVMKQITISDHYPVSATLLLHDEKP